VERLRGLDTAFLYAETPTNHMHVAWAAVLDTSDAPDAADAGRLAELIGARLHRLPALRKRLANPRLGYTQPDWITVDVDPADHIEVHDAKRLEPVAARVLTTPLDRNRPLWEMHVVPHLADGRSGIVMKLHHAVLDGPSGAELMVQLLDMEPTRGVAPRVAPAPRDTEPTSSDLRGVARRRAARGAARAAAGIRHAVDVAAATNRWDLEHPSVAYKLSAGAPRTLFNQPVSARRTVRSLEVSLDSIDELRRATSSTVNDAVLAITGGALRRYLRRHHALPASPLLAMVPTSLREGEQATGGNRTSALHTTLATDIADPGERLVEVTRMTGAAKRRHDETGQGSLVGLSDLVPPRAAQGLARLAGRVRLAAWGPLTFNIVVSNVPGPDVPFYCNGALVESTFPMGPVTDWSAINVTVVSYRRRLAFGVVACPDVVPDIDRLMDDLREELDAFAAAVLPTFR
jgi:diacylglycerol O-acyltransferase / wax synthase